MGEFVSGAAAFVSIWRELPRWRWAASIAGSGCHGAARKRLSAVPAGAADIGLGLQKGSGIKA